MTYLEGHIASLPLLLHWSGSHSLHTDRRERTQTPMCLGDDDISRTVGRVCGMG